MLPFKNAVQSMNVYWLYARKLICFHAGTSILPLLPPSRDLHLIPHFPFSVQNNHYCPLHVQKSGNYCLLQDQPTTTSFHIDNSLSRKNLWLLLFFINKHNDCIKQAVHRFLYVRQQFFLNSTITYTEYYLV